MFALDPFLGVRPSRDYLYLLFASPAGAYFPRRRAAGVGVAVDRVRPGRARRHRRGQVRAATTPASLVAQAQAAEQGCDQVVWLDAVEHRYVEEMGGMNLYFVLRRRPAASPRRSPARCCPASPATRSSPSARDLGLDVEERRITTDEWETGCADGTITEVFACGTAAVVTPVGEVKHARRRLHGRRRPARARSP